MFELAVLSDYLPELAHGALVTISIFLTSAIISVVAGVFFAVGILYGPTSLRLAVRALHWPLMGTPLLLQLFLIYYGLSQIGVRIPAIWTGIIGIGLHFAAYNADVFKTAILTIDKGQTEGARSLGFSKFETLLYVIVPQALRDSLNQVANNLLAMIKDVSLVSILGITELVHAAQQGISATYKPFEFYFAVGAIYYALNMVLELTLRQLERKLELQR
ncbi:amino acid ABC transporter permease (plasmid) [Agrobacterium sp. rho-13.3]|uniref:amino acid ABC transporter permease n=1 Tax=Agrobacterium sp. rho-13.3 TaxID=3072980 RepID=UPI002A121458|nr:amino acid ABC transporter permease [Agrobacterium sp. rho-13.3]MDX8310228.1 amino acid ABC transporter permease [Agrobacterium sp. rho-13.3]